MKIKQLQGWPPGEFQCAENTAIPFKPHEHHGLLIVAVDFVAGSKGRHTPGTVVLTLNNEQRGEQCTARLKVHDFEIATRLQAALEQCQGLTLEQAGLREITP